jgi:hypothetical protein
MKKLPLALVTIMILAISVYLLSCKKETDEPQKLPAIQKIRQGALKEWEIAPEESLMQIPITYDQKLKPEFTDWQTDSNIVVTVRVKFKDQDAEVKLPYVVSGLGGTRHYFYSLTGGKPRLLYHVSGICDYTGTLIQPKTVEGLTISYESMGIK